MRRSFISPDAIHGDEVRVTDRRELHHLRDVLRVSAGERLLFFDGSGQTWVGEVTGLSSTALTARVQSAAPTHAPGLAMTLVQAIPKHDRLDAIVEHASALGVARIIPVISARTIARPAGPRAEAKRSRWQRLAVAAAKQCGRADVVEIAPVMPFAEALTLLPAQALILVPTLAGPTRPLKQVLRGLHPPQPFLFIGPEGDWTPDEVAALCACGGRPVSLGPLTLRSDTAAIATLAMIQYHFGLAT